MKLPQISHIHINRNLKVYLQFLDQLLQPYKYSWQGHVRNTLFSFLPVVSHFNGSQLAHKWLLNDGHLKMPIIQQQHILVGVPWETKTITNMDVWKLKCRTLENVGQIAEMGPVIRSHAFMQRLQSTILISFH